MKTHRYLLALCCSLTVLSFAVSGADPLEGGRFNANFEMPQGIAYSPDGSTLAVFGMLKSGRQGVDLLDARTGKLSATFIVDGRIHTLVFSPDGKFMVAGLPYDVLVWDLISGGMTSLPRAKKIERVGVQALEFSKGGEVLVVGREMRGVEIWDFPKRKRVRQIKPDSFYKSAIALSPDGKMLATTKGDPSILLWDVVTGKKLIEEKMDRKLISKLHAVRFSPDGGDLIVYGREGILRWQVLTRGGDVSLQKRGKFQDPVFPNGVRMTSLVVSADGKLLAMVLGGVVRIWDTEKCRACILVERSSTLSIRGVSFSPDGKTLAVVFRTRDEAGGGKPRGFVKLWSVDEMINLAPEARAEQIRRAAVDYIQLMEDRGQGKRPQGRGSDCLAVIGQSEAAVPIFLKALESPDVDMRFQVMFALNYIGSKSPTTQAAFKQLLLDESPMVAKYAARTLSAMNPDKFPKEKLWVLMQRKPDVVVRRDGQLYYWGRSIENWITLLGKHHAPNEIFGRSPRGAPVAAIRKFGRDALPVALRLLKSEDRRNNHPRLGAIDALGVLGFESLGAVDKLLPFIENKSRSSSSVAAQSVLKILRDADINLAEPSEPETRSRAAVKAQLPKLKLMLSQKKGSKVRERIQNLIDYLEAGPPPAATREVRVGFQLLSKRLAKTKNYSFRTSNKGRGKVPEEEVRGSIAQENGVVWESLRVEADSNTYRLVLKNKSGAIHLAGRWLTVEDIVLGKIKLDKEALGGALSYMQGYPSVVQEAIEDLKSLGDFSRKENRYVAEWSEAALKHSGITRRSFWVEMKNGIPVKWGSSEMHVATGKDQWFDTEFEIEKMGTTQLKIPAAARERLKKPQVPPDWLK